LHYKDIPLYFLANTKTDIHLAKKLQNKFQYQIFASPQKHDKAMAVIAKSYMIIGGRQHPNIFAAIHQVPFVPLQGNTHKMEGVVELLNYPMEVLKWEDINSSNIQTIFENIESSRDKLYLNVTVPKLNSIKLA
jgi:polysaccharide pyruvyl transferase WcaK-like protein